MSTPQSSTDAYATSDDMQAYHKVPVLCELCSDGSAPLAAAALANSPRLLKALKAASGEVEAACFVAGAYSPQDLQAMAGTVSGEMLVETVCDLAMGKLYRSYGDRGGESPKYVEEAKELLELLRKGQRVFGLAEQQKAGQLSVTTDSPDDPWHRRGLVRTARRFFGVRGWGRGDGFGDGGWR